MIVNDLSLSASERGLLREAIGRPLACAEGLVIGLHDEAWGTVRLHFADGGKALDVTSSEAVIGTTAAASQEVCTLRVSTAPDEPLVVDIDGEPRTFDTAGTVQGFEVLDEHISLSVAGADESETTLTQAVVVRLPEKLLVLDRGIWFNEALKVSCVTVETSLDLYDDGPDWLGDPEECPEETWSYDRALLVIDEG